MNRMIACVAALFVVAAFAVAAEKQEGLKVGDSVAAFNVKDVTGPSAGKSLCYRCQFGAKPVACVFTREITDEVAALVKQIDDAVAANQDKKMCSFVVLLTEDPDAGAKALKKLASDKGIKHVPLTIFDGKTGPEAYKIGKDSAVTAILWNKGRVQANHAFASAKISEEGLKAVAADTSKILN